MKQIIARIKSESKSRGIIAIDGYDASGKTFFSNQLKEKLSEIGVKTELISIDHFHLPKEKRYAKGTDSAIGFYYDSYDYKGCIDKTLKPFKENSPEICSKVFDLKSDLQKVTTMKIPESCLLIVEGIFLQRTELQKFWDISIYLKISEEESLSRNLKREFGAEMPAGMRERFFNRYICGQRLYHNEFQPELLADFVIDNSDFKKPKMISKK